jgi:hypothetical protein
VKIWPELQGGLIRPSTSRQNASTFFGQKSGDKWTQKAYKDGTPVPGRPDPRVLKPGVSTGTGPNGGMKKQVKVHIKKNGTIHGNPSGPEHN